MLRVIKNKGTTVKAYQLGSNHEVIKKLMERERFAIWEREDLQCTLRKQSMGKKEGRLV